MHCLLSPKQAVTYETSIPIVVIGYIYNIRLIIVSVFFAIFSHDALHS